MGKILGDALAKMRWTKTAEQRFWAKVKKTDTCWIWQAHCMPYGTFREGGVGGGRKVLAHRWAYETLVGPIPSGLEIDHLCRNPPCVNPAHLETVTRSVNVRRGLIGHQVVCRKGHPLSEARVTPGGTKRDCRRCHNERHKRYRRERRAAKAWENLVKE